MDPLARLQIAGDTTLAIMLAAQARGHEIWFCEPRHLSLEHADAGRARLARDGPPRRRATTTCSGRRATVPLQSYDAVFMRKDPPFDLDYYFATLLLERARGQDADHQRPARPARAEREARRAQVPRPLPADASSRARPTRLRSFLAEQGGEMVVKPLDASGGFGVFHVRQRRPQHRRDPRAGDQPRPPLDHGAEVPARGARRATSASCSSTASRCARCCACRAPTTRAATCTSAPSRWRPSSTSATQRSSRALGPRLRERGHFFVGLDVIGGWLTEVNVTSPTGILEANALYGDTYEVKVVERLEQKTRAAMHSRRA